MDLTAQRHLVLIAETHVLVGEDVSDALKQAGYRVIGPFVTTAVALAAIERESPTLAVIDIELRDGVSTALGRELRRRGIPILVHSTLKQDDPRALSFQGLPWLNAPALPKDVVALLGDLAPLRSPTSVETASPMPMPQPAGSMGNPLIRKLEGFVPLSQADRAILERITVHPRLVGRRTDLIREGDTPDGVFLIMDGMACRHKQRSNGTRQIMAYLLPGDFCDLDVALLNTMDHSLSTLSPCKVIHIPAQTIAELMQHHPRLARAMRMSTLVDEATLREWLVNVGRRSALERIAHLFCELLVRLEVVGLAENESYALPLTQFELADTTGLSSVHVNRSLQEFRRQGLIEFKGGRLTILDLPRTRVIADFKSNYLHLGDRVAA